MLCQDAIPGFLGLFDLSIAPKLLYYAYIPAIITSIFFALVIIWRDSFSRIGWAFLATSITFSAWLINEIVQWTAAYQQHILLGWQWSMFLESLLFSSILFTVVSFIRESKSLRYLAIVNAITIPVTFLIMKSPLNIASYDYVSCEGLEGPAWQIYYIVQALILIFAWYLGHRALNKKITAPNEATTSYRKKALLGMIIFGISFLAANILSGTFELYQLNIIIPLGMMVCIILIALPAVEYPLFSFRFFRSEILVYVTMALVGSLLLIPDVASQKIVIIGTLIALFFLGRSIIPINKRESEQRQLLENLNHRLISLDAKKSEFLSFATHQLRSPLTSIKWGLNALEDDYNKETLTTLKTATDNLINTVGDLLDISKIEQGGLVMKLEKINLDEVVKQVVEEFTITAQKKSLDMTFVNKNGTCTLSADPNKLRQVFVNIIDNAIKYTDTGTITVRLVHDTKQATVEITDTGAGISPEEISGLFTKFIQGKAGSKTKTSSGLGLYLAKKIMEMLHGDITVQSEGSGKGSTFTITIPMI